MDEILRVLADERRRDIVAALDGAAESWITTDELSRSIGDAGWEGELFHVHLPMLRDAGLLDYDEREGLIRYYRCDLVSAVLDTVEHETASVR
ncbi:ArsR family transcriptional regulator [Natronococcus sp. A-GB1]|uniref:ArsR family transcriptional regulator n=1 Tax=Natronococcus sp. A-GB1 TaxID=3037648 RepID=UPI00241CE678|nr:ArsR family transcriptional regulator [Natronococcus sp. A-GB1]MDG5760207.1 ArsR family transcriptional regulator [Natronococcus sp. A-GB1]